VKRNPKFEVLGSKFRKPRTSVVWPFPSVSRGDCAMSRQAVKNNAGEYVEEGIILPDFCSHRGHSFESDAVSDA